MSLKLNGGRKVAGILRGFDPFMNVVIDDTIEENRDGTKNNIGMVVSLAGSPRRVFFLINSSHKMLFVFR